jgi:formylglycine-generating enzyme required for sulfatase activity
MSHLAFIDILISPVERLASQTPPPPTTPPPPQSQMPQWLVYLLDGDFGSFLNLIWPTAWYLAILAVIIYLLIRFHKPIRKFAADWLPWAYQPREPDLVEDPARIGPLADREEARFVPLESGLLDDLKLELSLRTRQPGGQDETFNEKGKFQNLQEALDYQENGRCFPALAFLGEPGSGKTWMLRKLARDTRDLRASDSSAKIPLIVSLSGYKGGKPESYLRRFWKDPKDIEDFDTALHEGHVLLLADGLNEMNQKVLYRHREKWVSFLRTKFESDGNRAIIACRIKDYGEGLELDQQLRLHPLDEDRIQLFLRNNASERADAIWQDLDNDRKKHKGRLYELATVPFWLAVLARAPSMRGIEPNRASLMDHFVERSLDEQVDRRSDLEITARGRRALIMGLSSLAWGALPESQLKPFRQARVWFELFKSGLRQKTAPNPLLDLAACCGLLVKASGRLSFPHQIFQEYFAARVLAEHFAQGKDLNKIWRIPWKKWSSTFTRSQPLPEPPQTGWDESSVIAAGALGLQSVEQAERLTLAILEQNPPLAAECALRSGIPLSKPVRRQVVRQLKEQIQAPQVRFPTPLYARLPAGLLTPRWRERQARQPELYAAALVSMRLAAARQLGQFEDDPDVGKRRHSYPAPDGEAQQYIEPDWLPVLDDGAFRMGSDPDNETYYPDETPPHRVHLSGYQIARTPVTVAEFRCFMDARGYEREDFWHGEADLRWLRGVPDFKDSYEYNYWVADRQKRIQELPLVEQLEHQGALREGYYQFHKSQTERTEAQLEERWRSFERRKRDDSGRVVRPWLWDDADYTNPAQPVIGISWYEAKAYAAWLTEALQADNSIRPGQSVRLPSEAQWEKAARGCEGRIWPWGNDWDAGLCNTLEGRILFPSPVGMYPNGASPYGALDMAGNVWEWCQDWYNPKEYEERAGNAVKDPTGPLDGTLRVVRGGSWDCDRDNARCAYRDSIEPGDFNSLLGFRVVLSPI